MHENDTLSPWVKDSKGLWTTGSDEDGQLWLAPSSIMIKIVTPAGDPVEMNADQARALAALLNKLADEDDA